MTHWTSMQQNIIWETRRISEIKSRITSSTTPDDKCIDYPHQPCANQHNCSTLPLLIWLIPPRLKQQQTLTLITPPLTLLILQPRLGLPSAPPVCNKLQIAEIIINKNSKKKKKETELWMLQRKNLQKEKYALIMLISWLLQQQQCLSRWQCLSKVNTNLLGTSHGRNKTNTQHGVSRDVSPKRNRSHTWLFLNPSREKNKYVTVPSLFQCLHCLCCLWESAWESTHVHAYKKKKHVTCRRREWSHAYTGVPH